MSTSDRVKRFCERHALGAPILLAPMAGVPSPELSREVMRAGGMGALGAAMMNRSAMTEWLSDVGGPTQVNLWVAQPVPGCEPEREAAARAFLSGWGPVGAGALLLPDFEEQCEALLDLRPAVVSSIFGLFSPEFVRRWAGEWFACVTTVREAVLAEQAGATAVVVQGFEAGGHRGVFDPEQAERQSVGLFALLPQVVDRVSVPVIAAGGIADGRGIAAALILGASAVQIGTAYLRSPSAGISSVWREALVGLEPEDTTLTRVFTGRLARGIATELTRAGERAEIAPYPLQRGLAAPLRVAAEQAGDLQRLQAWAGQAAGLATEEPAEAWTRRVWGEALGLLGL